MGFMLNVEKNGENKQKVAKGRERKKSLRFVSHSMTIGIGREERKRE